MAKIGVVGDGHRDGAVKKRSQLESPLSRMWTKRDRTSGEFIDAKKTPGKFKGVRREGLPAKRKTATPAKSSTRSRSSRKAR